MRKLKSHTIKFDPSVYYTAASSINDRIFLSFPVGFILGVIAGAIYAGFYWDNLRVEFGRTLLLAAAVQAISSCWMVNRVIKKIVR